MRIRVRYSSGGSNGDGAASFAAARSRPRSRGSRCRRRCSRSRSTAGLDDQDRVILAVDEQIGERPAERVERRAAEDLHVRRDGERPRANARASGPYGWSNGRLCSTWRTSGESIPRMRTISSSPEGHLITTESPSSTVIVAGSTLIFVPVGAAAAWPGLRLGGRGLRGADRDEDRPARRAGRRSARVDESHRVLRGRASDQAPIRALDEGEAVAAEAHGVGEEVAPDPGGGGEGGQGAAERLDRQVAVVAARLQARPERRPSRPGRCRGCPGRSPRRGRGSSRPRTRRSPRAWSFSSMCAWKLSYIIRTYGWSTARTNRAAVGGGRQEVDLEPVEVLDGDPDARAPGPSRRPGGGSRRRP